MDDLSLLDATASAALVHAGDVTPSELVEAAVRRVETLDGHLNAVVHERFDRALDEARRIDHGAPFAGVPIVVKDYDGPLAGEPFHGGMRFLRRAGFREHVDSHMVTRLREAGFVVIGKTNTPELGLQATTEPEAYGPTLNPWDPTRSTGGSSGGSAAAVAAGMVPLAHGGDGGGSLRIPAGACGLVGLKPTRGRVSLGPLEGENWAGFVSRHVLTRTVRDSARVLDLLAGREPGDPTGLPRPPAPFLASTRTDGPRLRIGVVDRLPGSGDLAAPACQRALVDTAETLASLGHEVTWSRPSAFDEASIVADLTTVVAVWVDHELHTWEGRAGAEVDPAELEVGTRGFAALGAAVTTSSYLAAVDRLHAWSRSLERWWTHEGHDLMLTPTTPVPSPEIGAVPSSVSEEDPAGLNALLVAFTAPFNISGQPAISVPGTPTSDGRPVGVQLAAAWGREDLLIRAAAELEEAAPWPLLAPLDRFVGPALGSPLSPVPPTGGLA